MGHIRSMMAYVEPSRCKVVPIVFVRCRDAYVRSELREIRPNANIEEISNKIIRKSIKVL